jgi:hypothetical protein
MSALSQKRTFISGDSNIQQVDTRVQKLPTGRSEFDDKDHSDGLRRLHAMGIECDGPNDIGRRTLHNR